MFRLIAVFLLLLCQTAHADVLSVEDLFGQFTFTRPLENEFENGFMQFNADHTWFLVSHTDKNHDQIPDAVDIKRGEYFVELNSEGHACLRVTGENGDSIEISPTEMVFSDGIVNSFSLSDRTFQRRLGSMPFFDNTKNQMPLAEAIHVDSNPKGARVFIDGQYVKGITPLVIEKPAANVEHILRIEYRKRPPVQKKIKLREGEKMMLHIEVLKGDTELWVRSEPSAKLFVDGRYQGLTTVKVDDLTPGKHEISLRIPSLNLNYSETVVLEKAKSRKYRSILPVARKFTSGNPSRYSKAINLWAMPPVMKLN